MVQRTAIIVAGGSGARMGAGAMGAATPKQFMELGGKPVLVRTVEQFVGIAGRIIVVLARGEMERWRALALRHGLATEVCEGGKTRFESVQNALAMLSGGDAKGSKGVSGSASAVPDALQGVVAVHDGVRPLVSRALVERVFAAAEKHGSAVPVVGAVDSFRLDGEVVDRDRLRAVQTPQAFDARALRDAYVRAAGIRVAHFTDDASVFEVGGHALHFVEGERENLKLTTPIDFRLAEALL